MMYEIEIEVWNCDKSAYVWYGDFQLPYVPRAGDFLTNFGGYRTVNFLVTFVVCNVDSKSITVKGRIQ